jgi:outer membrane lipoprotein-sorting protein
VKRLRTMSISRLAGFAVAVVVIFAGSAVAVAARSGHHATPAPKPLAQAIHDALGGSEPSGITARITFTNKLFPSGALAGQAGGSTLMSGASGRLWANGSGGRLELQSTDGNDAQIVWNDSKVTIYDASSNTAYAFELPKQQAETPSSKQHTAPSVDQITKLLTELGKNWTVSGAQPSNVAGQEAYTVKISPSHDGGLLGAAELAFDAANGVPLKVAITAQGQSSPVLALRATDITFGNVPTSDIAVSPPAGAKIVDLSSAGAQSGHGSKPAPVTGLPAVTAAAPFTVVAPDRLVGLPLQDVRLVGGKTVVATYGQGLGAIIVVERAQDAQAGSGGMLRQLPSVSLDGITAHEIATQLGTILTWDRNGVSFVLAGSVPPAAAETAARSLK